MTFTIISLLLLGMVSSIIISFVVFKPKKIICSCGFKNKKRVVNDPYFQSKILKEENDIKNKRIKYILKKISEPISSCKLDDLNNTLKHINIYAKSDHDKLVLHYETSLPLEKESTCYYLGVDSFIMKLVENCVGGRVGYVYSPRPSPSSYAYEAYFLNARDAHCLFIIIQQEIDNETMRLVGVRGNLIDEYNQILGS